MEDTPAFIPREASKDTLRLSLIERSHRSHTGSYESSTGFKRLWDSTSRLRSIGPDQPLPRHKHGVCWVRSLLPPNIQEILMCIGEVSWRMKRTSIDNFKNILKIFIYYIASFALFIYFLHFLALREHNIVSVCQTDFRETAWKGK